MTRDVTPYLLVRCEACSEESNCHPPSKMRWSVTMEGYEVDPIPVCEGCWGEACHDNRGLIELPDWNSLEPVVLPLKEGCK